MRSGRFLRALGVTPHQVPAELAELAALYRSLLADRRMLVVLDDALTGALARALDEASAEDPEFGTQLRELWDRVGLRAAAGDQGIAGGPDRAARLADSHFSLTDAMLAELHARLHLHTRGENDARSQGQ
jgi:hypothetical protein